VLIVLGLLVAAGAAWYFLQSRADTTIGLTLTSNPTLEQGLELHYTFDGPEIDLASTTREIRDRSGNNYHADWLSHASTTTAGPLGQAISFSYEPNYANGDGATGYATEDVLRMANSATLGFWIRPRSHDFAATVLGHRKTGWPGWLVNLAESGSLSFSYRASETESTGCNFLGSAPVGQWTHALVVVDRENEEFRCYANGVLQDTTSATTTMAAVGSNTIGLGKHATADLFHYDGALDDVRIYSRALSAEEVKRLYELGATTYVGETLTTNPDLESGLVGHWTFDGEDVDWSSTTAEIRDRSGNGYHGDATNGLDYRSAARGVLGQALDFEDLGTNQVVIGTGPQSEYTNIASMCAYFYARSSDPGGNILGDARNFYVDMTTAGQLRFKLYNGTTAYFADSVVGLVEFDEWHHVCGVADGADLRLYFDGELDTNDIQPYVGSVSDSGGWVIGRVTTAGTEWGGYIDDVRIYNRALSAEEVKRLYGLGATTKVAQTITSNPTLEDGLVGHWTFDGEDVDWSSTTAEVRDRSGQENHGDATGGLSTRSPVMGVLGQGLEFDNNTSDNIRIGAGTNLDMDDQVTFAGWAKIGDESTTEYYGILHSPARQPRGSGVWLGYYQSGQLRFRVEDAAGSPVIQAAVANYTEWHHAAGTYDGSTMRLYVDGVEVASTTKLLSGSIIADGDYVIAATDVDSTARHFPGSLDDVRIYNRALSADEVRRLYELGQ